jgi:hypothetical protein
MCHLAKFMYAQSYRLGSFRNTGSLRGLLGKVARYSVNIVKKRPMGKLLLLLVGEKNSPVVYVVSLRERKKKRKHSYHA